jgi:hypothetical protein
MPAGSVTVTVSANTGPGQATGTIVITNVRNINFRFIDGAVDVYSDDASGAGPRFQTFQYSALTTVTITPAARTVAMS